MYSINTMHSCVKLCVILATVHQFKTSLALPFRPELVLLDANPVQTGLKGGSLADDVESKLFIEGDIKVTEVEPYQNVRLDLRSTVVDKAKVWTNGIIPYSVDTTFFTLEQLATIRAAMDEIGDKTCVTFVERATQMPYLFITVLSRCWSEIGMPPEEGIRTLSLGTACLNQRGTVLHELLHILGFWHEQNRPDRDDYVTVNWNNIAEGMEHNFVKYSANKVDTLDEPYDYDSIMHYASFAFAKSAESPTIEPRIPVMIGQRFALSPLDVRKINKLYKCSTSTSGRPNLSAATAWIVEPSSDKPDQHSTATLDASRIVFPTITELVPLPFRFNWSHTSKPTQPLNAEIVFPKNK